MKTVRIYIETSFRRPAVRDGKYASALVFTRRGSRVNRYGDRIRHYIQPADAVRSSRGIKKTESAMSCDHDTGQLLCHKHDHAGKSGEVAPVRMEKGSRDSGAE